jgi:hypothetical protein
MFVDTRWGNTTRYYSTAPKDASMRLSEEWFKTVVFVGRIVRSGGVETKRLIGTAFIVGVHFFDGKCHAPYLVTAKHIADRVSSGGDWFLRFNRKGGIMDAVAKEGTVTWWNHPDPDQTASVDVAVTHLPEPPPGVEIGTIPDTMFAVGDVLEKNVGIGCEAFIIGLFTKMTGTRRNIPLIRTANIAMMPSEKIPLVKIGDWVGESEMYLIEVRSLGGLSGSPIFAYETVGFQRPKIPNQKTTGPELMAGTGASYFLGLMHGHWMIREQDANRVQIDSVQDGEGSIATGISLAVPAKKILEVLNHPELVAMRAALEAAERAREGTTCSD